MTDVDFTKSDLALFSIAMFRVYAKSVAECGPYQITRAGKTYRLVDKRQGLKFKRFQNLKSTIKKIEQDRKNNFRNWIVLGYNPKNIYNI